LQNILPEENQWFEFLAGNKVSWWRALLTSHQFADGKFRVPNGVKQLFRPRPGHKYVVTYSKDVPSSVELRNHSDQLVSQVTFENSKKITVTIYHTMKSQQIPLQLEYHFQPECGNQALIRSINNNNSIKNFYSKLWFSDSSLDFSTFNLKSQFESVKTITKSEIELFSNSIAGSKPTFNIRSGKYVDLFVTRYL
jgi:enoyl reductase-like protein